MEPVNEPIPQPPTPKKPMYTKRQQWMLVFMAVALGAMYVWSSSQGGMSSPDVPERTSTPSASMLKFGASDICEQFVNDRLKSPSTAKYKSYNEGDVVGLGNNEFRVKSHVDAVNSFNAEIRNNYTCVVRSVGNDEWKLVSLDME